VKLSEFDGLGTLKYAPAPLAPKLIIADE